MSVSFPAEEPQKHFLSFKWLLLICLQYCRGLHSEILLF